MKKIQSTHKAFSPYKRETKENKETVVDLTRDDDLQTRTPKVEENDKLVAGIMEDDNDFESFAKKCTLQLEEIRKQPTLCQITGSHFGENVNIPEVENKLQEFFNENGEIKTNDEDKSRLVYCSGGCECTCEDEEDVIERNCKCGVKDEDKPPKITIVFWNPKYLGLIHRLIIESIETARRKKYLKGDVDVRRAETEKGRAKVAVRINPQNNIQVLHGIINQGLKKLQKETIPNTEILFVGIRY